MNEQISYTGENGHEIRLQVLDMKTGVYRQATVEDLRAVGWVPKEEPIIVEAEREPARA